MGTAKMGQASLHIRFKLVSSLLTFVSLFLSQTLLGADNVPAEDFKTFLKSPPVVVRVIIAQRILQVSTPPHRKNPVSPESVTNEIQYFAGAQQPGAFFLRRMRSMGDDAVLIDAAFRTSGLLFSGKNGQRDWFIVNTNISSYVEPSSANSGDDNYVHLTTEGAANILSSILHFGIVNLRDDSLVWQGNHFTATSRNGEELSGDLTTSNDFPQSLTVYNKSKPALQFVADYSFAPASPNGLQIKYLPSTTLLWRIVDKVREPVWEAKLLELTVTNRPMETAYFGPERFIDSSTISQAVITNGEKFFIRSNTLVPSMVPLNAAITPETNMGTKRVAIIAILVIISIFPILLFLKTRTKSGPL